jgi:SAM-dependent methyltransferase
LDFFSDHYYRSKSDFDESRVNYDIRKDVIPYANSAIDNIYISHAIEHIETEYVERFFREAFRVLRPRGILRVACPDARFLYQVSCFENDYWAWREPSLIDPASYDCSLADVTQSDYLTRELATPKMRFYRNRQANAVDQFEVSARPYEELMCGYRDGLSFRSEHPGDHINNWDFDRLEALGRRVGFAQIIESKCHGSISREMQGEEFDRTAPQMSLYVDFMK